MAIRLNGTHSMICSSMQWLQILRSLPNGVLPTNSTTTTVSVKQDDLHLRKTADYAFILHMVHHLNEGGTMACVAPHGVLFRGNAEGVIRRFLIEKKNYMDAIIGLPANIFYGTSIPTCILVLKKCRKEDDNILVH